MNRGLGLRGSLRLAALAPGLFAAGLVFAEPAFLSPGRGESLAPGAIVEVRWGSLCLGKRERGFHEAELMLSLDGGLTFPVRVSHELSPCATETLWRVPVMPTGRARLAIRVGFEPVRNSETIVAVSAEFRILPDLDGREQQPAEPAMLSAEDLLGTTVSPEHGRLVEPQAEDTLEDPPSLGTSAARHAAPLLASTRSPRSSAPWARCLSFVGAATPLRL